MFALLLESSDKLVKIFYLIPLFLFSLPHTNFKYLSIFFTFLYAQWLVVTQYNILLEMEIGKKKYFPERVPYYFFMRSHPHPTPH